MHLYRSLLRDHARLRRAARRPGGAEAEALSVLFQEHALREERALLGAVALQLGPEWLPLRVVRLQHADLALSLARWIATSESPGDRALADRVCAAIREHLAYEEEVLFPTAARHGILPPLTWGRSGGAELGRR